MLYVPEKLALSGVTTWEKFASTVPHLTDEEYKAMIDHEARRARARGSLYEMYETAMTIGAACECLITAYRTRSLDERDNVKLAVARYTRRVLCDMYIDACNREHIRPLPLPNM